MKDPLEAICLRLDCLPLALELCAAQVDLLSPTQLLARLHTHHLDLLVDGAHDLPLHQRSLRTAIGASYAMLDEAERSLLRCLGIFMGGCDWQAVAAVAADHVELSARPLHSILHALVDKSLVRVETLPDGEQRFLLLETIREFAREQVRARGEEAHLRRRHYAIYLQFFRTGDSHLRGPDAAAWFARLGPEQDNLRAATLFGLADQMHSQVHYAIGGPIRSLADAALTRVRRVLDPAVFAETFAAGRQMSDRGGIYHDSGAGPCRRRA